MIYFCSLYFNLFLALYYSTSTSQSTSIGQFQKISIPNHGRLPCFNPPLPSEIPECVTPPMPSEFHNREPPLPFGISRVFWEVHFRLGNVYMNKRTWIYASQRLLSSGARRQALLFSDKNNLPRVARLCNLFFKSKFAYKKTPLTVIFILFVFLCCSDVYKAK